MTEFDENQRAAIREAARRDFRAIPCPVDGQTLDVAFELWRDLEADEVPLGFSTGRGHDVWRIYVRCSKCSREGSSIGVM
jgi:hypothetical protein